MTGCPGMVMTMAAMMVEMTLTNYEVCMMAILSWQK